jgi:hypothetical protein
MEPGNHGTLVHANHRTCFIIVVDMKSMREQAHLAPRLWWSRGGPMSVKEDEGAALRDLAEIYPTLKELRLANPPGAGMFLVRTNKQSENWPTASLIDGYLDARP